MEGRGNEGRVFAQKVEHTQLKFLVAPLIKVALPVGLSDLGIIRIFNLIL